MDKVRKDDDILYIKELRMLIGSLCEMESQSLPYCKHTRNKILDLVELFEYKIIEKLEIEVSEK